MIYPAVYNLTIEQRASFARTFALLDSAGTPINLTGFTPSASVYTETGILLIAFTFTWVNQALGQFTLTLTASQTSLLSGSGFWDLKVINPDSTVDYYLRGEVYVERGYTR